MAAAHAFTQPSRLPYRLPPFDRIREPDFRPAFADGMAEQRREIDAIARDAALPTFDNTVVALERSGQMLARVSAVFFNLTAANTSPELDRINEEMAPRLAAHHDAIYLDPALFARVRHLHERRRELGLDAESLRLLERYHTLFLRAGAALGEAQKAELRAFNERLSTLATQFQQAVLKATNEGAVVVEQQAQLDGLSAAQTAAAAEAARQRGLHGKWLLTLHNTTAQPLLSALKDRALRERLYRASTARGRGGAHDTTALVAEMVRLRAARARLLGYASHAAYVLADETAGSTDAVNRMLADLAPAALANARRDALAMQRLIDDDCRARGEAPFALAAWDWAFYAERLRRAQHDFDEADVRPYLELENVLHNGVFFAAQELFGLGFRERTDLPVYHPDVRVFEVFEAGGAPLGLFLADFFARDTKQGGAWMNEYAVPSRLTGQAPVVGNHLNIVRPPPGEPVLLSFDEVTTLFHEFGHALHGLLSDVHFPLLAGTSVPRDFVEFPSQYNEMWAAHPRVLASFARHWQTGAPMPQALMDKVLAARRFNQGFATAEYLAAALLDQAWHQVTPEQAPPAEQVKDFEREALRRAGVDWEAVPPRYHTPYFAHAFAGGYAAGYYAYIWSDVLASDTEDWFGRHGGLQRANGDFLRGKLLARGNSADCIALFREFYGRDPEIGPLLEHRGLVLAPS